MSTRDSDGGGAGTGISAKSEEAGGIDLLVTGSRAYGPLRSVIVGVVGPV